MTRPCAVANRGLYSALGSDKLLKRRRVKLVFPPFCAEPECSHEMDAIDDTATPTEAQAIPWSAGIKFHCRNPEGLRAWLASAGH